MIAARTKAALGVKKAKGEKTRGSVPFRFILAAEGVHLEPHPVEHPVLVRILELRRAGMGGRRIAAALTAEGHQPQGCSVESWKPAGSGAPVGHGGRWPWLGGHLYWMSSNSMKPLAASSSGAE